MIQIAELPQLSVPSIGSIWLKLVPLKPRVTVSCSFRTLYRVDLVETSFLYDRRQEQIAFRTLYRVDLVETAHLAAGRRVFVRLSVPSIGSIWLKLGSIGTNRLSAPSFRTLYRVDLVETPSTTLIFRPVADLLSVPSIGSIWLKPG